MTSFWSASLTSFDSFLVAEVAGPLQKSLYRWKSCYFLVLWPECTGECTSGFFVAHCISGSRRKSSSSSSESPLEENGIFLRSFLLKATGFGFLRATFMSKVSLGRDDDCTDNLSSSASESGTPPPPTESTDLSAGLATGTSGVSSLCSVALLGGTVSFVVSCECGSEQSVCFVVKY